MSRKFLLTALVIAVLMAAVGIAVASGTGEDTVEINQQIAGSIFNGLEVTVDGATENRSLLNLYAKGAPGAANAEVVGGAIPAAEPSGLCPPETDLELIFIDGGFVETFKDHSMLFYVIDTGPNARNALCVDFQGPSVGFFDYLITGGTGRFAGATGSAFVHVIETWSVTAELSAEVGTIEGSFQVP